MPNFNTAEDQQSFEIIPKGTIAKVRLEITPGGYDDLDEDWTGGFATCNPETDAVYLKCIFTVLEGQHAKRKVWSNIGLRSAKGPTWKNMGYSFMKNIINSAHGLSKKDQSPQAVTLRNCPLGHLSGLELTAKIDIEKDSKGGDKNVIKEALTPDDKGYLGGSGSRLVSSPALSSQTNTSLPSWAQS